MTTKIHGVEVISNSISDKQELEAYVQRGLEQPDGNRLVKVEVEISKDDPESVDIKYHIRKNPFERIRRITGYLVGTLERFNNGKRAEEHDRVKHGVFDNGTERSKSATPDMEKKLGD